MATSQSFGGFIRGQFGIAALYGVVVGIIAFVFGVPFVALTAVLTAALQSIPYFGQLVSWLPLFATTLVFAPNAIVPVTICLVAGLLIIQNIISPRVLGSAVGLNPILVLAAVFVGAQIAGAIGGVFGVPVAAVGATLFNAWLDQVRPPAAIDVAEGKHRPRTARRTATGSEPTRRSTTPRHRRRTSWPPHAPSWPIPGTGRRGPAGGGAGAAVDRSSRTTGRPARRLVASPGRLAMPRHARRSPRRPPLIGAADPG